MLDNRHIQCSLELCCLPKRLTIASSFNCLITWKLMSFCFPGNRLTFWPQKSAFIGFCCLYVLVSPKNYIVKKRPRSTLSTNMSGSPNSYITFRKLAFSRLQLFLKQYTSSNSSLVVSTSDVNVAFTKSAHLTSKILVLVKTVSFVIVKV